MYRPLILAALPLLLTLMNSPAAKAHETVRVGLIQMNARLYDK
jgi:hypothetical protein